jgi:hypothetical protein
MIEFTSLLLDQPVVLVEPFGEPEPSFIGGGRAGAGGTPDGAWDFLIGPTYSSPNFLHEERLSVGWHGGRNRSIAPAMHRVAGSGLLCGRQRVGDLEIEVWEVSPWDGQEVLRVVAVANRGGTILRRIRVQAFVRAPGKPAVHGQALHIALPQGTPSYGGECPSWAERTARIAWNRPADLCNDWRDNVGAGFFLTCGLGDLAPGATTVASLVHRLDEGAGLPALDLPVDPAVSVKRELAAWQEWFGRGIAAARGDVLVESQLAFIRMQQSFDGGFIAGVRRYAYSYIRDMHGACRGLLAAGHAGEVARALAWIDRKVRRFGTVVNASEMGADVRDFVGGHKGTELPAYYLLMAVSLLRNGRAEAVDACRASLVQAADEQIAVSRADGWRFHYNGDETERYVPVVDGANYLFNKPDWDPRRACWSMPSHVLAMASLDAFARHLCPLWNLDPAPYRAAVEEWRASFAPTFQPDGRPVPAWTVFPDGTLPAYPVPNYLLFPAWVDAPFPAATLREWTVAAAAHLDADRGFVPVCPGAVQGTCGHNLALLLYSLCRTAAPTERIAAVERLARDNGQLQWFGLVNEFYGPDGTPNQHNLRPFETGPMVEALLIARIHDLADSDKRNRP